jgi:hypothetical protein
MIQRREFLSGLFVAPAIVHAENLMKIRVPEKEIITAHIYGFSDADIAYFKAHHERVHPGIELVLIKYLPGVTERIKTLVFKN